MPEPVEPIVDTPSTSVSDIESQPIMSLNDALAKALEGKEFPNEPVQEPEKNTEDKKSHTTPEKQTQKPEEKSDDIKSEIPDEITKKIAGIEDKKEEKTDAPVIPDELPADKKAQGIAYKNMRELNKKLMTENAELKKNKPQANDEVTKEHQLLKAEYENLKKEKEEYEQYLQLHKLESTKAYQNIIAKPINAIKDTIRTLAKKYEVKANDILEAFDEKDIGKRNEMLSELTAGFNDYDKLLLSRKSDDYTQKLQEEGVMRGKAKEALDFLTAKEKQEAEQGSIKMAQAHEQAANDTFKRLTENFGFMQKIEGNEEWNKEIEDINKTARAVDISKLSPQELAEMKYLALSFGRQNKILQAYAKELHAHKERLASMRKGTPDLNKGSAPTKSDTDDSNLSFLDAINAKLGS